MARTGLVVPEGDARALARALAELAIDEAMRRRMGDRASNHVLAWRYTAAADAFAAALEAAVGHRARCGS